MITYCFGVCFLVLLIVLHKRGIRIDFLIILMFFLIGMLHQSNNATLHTNDIYFFINPDTNKASMRGVVASHIQEGPYDSSFVLHPRYLRTGSYHGAVRGKLLVRFNKRVNFQFGDHLGLEGRLRALKDSGYFNQRLIRQGIRSVLYVGWGDWLGKERPGSISIQRCAFAIREKLKARFSKISSPTRDFLAALILGDRSGLSKELYSVFRYTGTVHILPTTSRKKTSPYTSSYRYLLRSKELRTKIRGRTT